LAKVAQEAQDNVWLEFNSEKIDAKQVIDILTLGAAKGNQVTIRIDSEEDSDTLNRAVELFENGFGE